MEDNFPTNLCYYWRGIIFNVDRSLVGNSNLCKNSGIKSQAMPGTVAHACNCSNSGGGDQEDCSSKLAQANSSQDPIWKKPITKKVWCSGPRYRPYVQTQIL
jgi:hypothetical protein